MYKVSYYMNNYTLSIFTNLIYENKANITI